MQQHVTREVGGLRERRAAAAHELRARRPAASARRTGARAPSRRAALGEIADRDVDLAARRDRPAGRRPKRRPRRPDGARETTAAAESPTATRTRPSSTRVRPGRAHDAARRLGRGRQRAERRRHVAMERAPAGVSASARWPRTNSGTPSASSSACTWRDSADCVTKSSCAARVNDSSAAGGLEAPQEVERRQSRSILCMRPDHASHSRKTVCSGAGSAPIMLLSPPS